MKNYIILPLLFLTIGVFAQNGNSVLIDGTLQVTEQTGSPTELVGQSAAGFLSHIEVGTGLELTSGTLKTVGGGLVFDDAEPVSLVGVNAASDTLTNIWITTWDEPGPGGGTYEINNTRLQNDTLYSLRGSYFQGFEILKWAKTIGPGVSDTLNIDPSLLFDFTESGGTYTYVEPDQYKYETIPTYTWSHLFEFTARIDLHTGTYGGIELAIYRDDIEVSECTVEYYLGGSDRTATISTNCLIWIIDGEPLDVRLKNASAGSVDYTIERANFNAHHIKSRNQPVF